MAAKVRWRSDRESWFLVIHRDGRKKWKRYGPKTADKRQAGRDAREYNRKLTRGQLGIDPPKVPKPKPVPFVDFAKEWYRRKVELPRQRGLDGHLSANTARLREQGIRLHLGPILGLKTLNVGRFLLPRIDPI